MENEMTGLREKVAMVTGGATGIGAAITERLALAGVRVACCYNKSGAKAEELAEKLRRKNREIYTVRVDVSDSRQVKDAVAAVAGHFGRPADFLVNNAGDLIGAANIDEMDEALWDKAIAVNLKGVFLCCKYCLPAMKAAGSGRIVNISSISAHTGGAPGGSHYAAGKGGVEAFTRALARELAPFNVTANAVSPGVVYTPIHERFNTPESLEKLRRNIPLLRLGEPEDVAGVVVFLCSADAAYITGEIIAVNGGLRMD